jgi:hypothetical protein
MEIRSLVVAFAIAVAPNILSAGSWTSDVKDAIDVKQAAFCNLVDSYKKQAIAAKKSRNMIKEMQVSEDQANDLKALIPNQTFSNWVARVDKVELLPSSDGVGQDKYIVRLTAALPCGVTLVSSEKSDDKKIGEKSTPVIFKQLEKVSSGDFVLVSGEFKNEFKAKEFCVDDDGDDQSQNRCPNSQNIDGIEVVFPTSYQSLVMFK